jgi:hypothetical protein
MIANANTNARVRFNAHVSAHAIVKANTNANVNANSNANTVANVKADNLVNSDVKAIANTHAKANVNANDNIELVVSRYNEDLKWTLEYPFNMFKFVVYNKGINENFVKTNVEKIVNLPNVGKCDHTYLYHIVENYDILKSITVFLPGSLHMANKKEKAVRILINIMNSKYKHAYFIGKHYDSVKQTFYNFTLNEWKTSCNENKLISNESKLQLCKIRPYGRWYDYFLADVPAKWSTFLGIFSIDNKDIIQHPVDRYKRLLETVSNSSNPEAGHYIERSWGAIFFPLMHTKKLQEK